MTDGNPKSGLPVDLVGTLSDGCEPYYAYQALKKLDNHLGGHGLLEFALLRAEHTQEGVRALLEANAAKPKPSDDPRKLDLTVPGANTRSDRHNYDDAPSGSGSGWRSASPALLPSIASIRRRASLRNAPPFATHSF